MSAAPSRDALTTGVASAIGDLTEPRRHIEPYWTWTPGRHRQMSAWTSDQPSLLDQLRQLADTNPVNGEPGTGGFESRPPGTLDALDRLVVIDAAVDDWLIRRLDLAHRDITIPPDHVCRHGAHGAVCDPCSQHADLRQLVGAAGHLHLDTLGELWQAARRWRTWAAVCTGWQSPAFAPQAPCPMCETVGRLRIRLDTRTATCLGCGEVWDQGSIGLLAEHIRDFAPDLPREVLQAACDHSWRRTGRPDRGGLQHGVCVRCPTVALRLAPPHRPRCNPKLGGCRRCSLHDPGDRWPANTPVWTALDTAAATA